MLLLTSLFVLFLLLVLTRSYRHWRLLPPGPLLPLPLLRRIPFSGYYGKDELQSFDRMRKIYGDTFSVHLGHKRVVIMSDYDQVKDVFVKKFTERPDEVLNHWREKQYGVIFTNGADWKLQRRLFLEVIKSTGFGKERLERSVDQIWPHLAAVMDTDEVLTFKAFELPLVEFLVYTFSDSSVFPNGRPEKETLNVFNVARYFGIQWCEYELWYRLPWLRVLLPGWSGYTTAKNMLAKCHQELENIIALHEADDSSNGSRPRDFIDIYLEKLQKAAVSDMSSSTSLLRGESGRKCVIATLDNVLVGGDGILMGMNATLYLLARNPLAQEKLRKDPTGDYARAFQMEAQRLVAQTGLGTPHQSSQDVIVDGNVIPAKTDVYPNLYHLLHDETHWGVDATQFHPERFLDDDGKVVSDPHWVPFEIGPRICPAKNFAIDALVALTARVVGSFKVEYAGRVRGEARKGDLLEGTVPSFKGLNVGGTEAEMEFVGMALVQPRTYALRFRKNEEGPLARRG